MTTIHIIGAGLAGLGAAVELAASGDTGKRPKKIAVYEAAPQAGGRCRSYFDSTLGMRIDNGNHLVLSGNRAVHDFTQRIGSAPLMHAPEEARFPFADLDTGERWEVHPNAGPLPWWIFVGSRRVPGTTPFDYLSLARLLKQDSKALLGPVIGEGALRRKLLDPLMIAALNTDPNEASAKLASAIVRETLAKGAKACRPLVARHGLAATFVDPALDFLEKRGVEVQFSARLRQLEKDGQRIAHLVFSGETIALAPDDKVILAVPAWVASSLLPDLSVPTEHRSILNAHFLLPPPAQVAPIMGLVNSTAEWVFAYENHVSVTVSAADRLIDRPREELAALLWRDVARAYGLDTPTPAWQIVKEKRATFAATPAQDALRPAAESSYRNLVLAGDWVQNGLPATIEGALRSGVKAAHLVD